MTPELQAFINAQDLDKLLSAQKQMGELNEADTKEVSSIINAWKPAQAVANLLFYPNVIPESSRFFALQKGLDERQNIYLVLAAVVGLQTVSPSSISEQQRTNLARALLKTIAKHDNVISERASVSINHFLNWTDAQDATRLLEHPNKTVSHNTLAWFVKIFEPEGLDVFEKIIAESAIAQHSKNEALTKFREHLEKKASGKFSSTGNFLFAYIPNLNEVSH